MVPERVQRLPKCSKLLATLEDMAEYMSAVGPKRMSRRKLVQVLATRTPWELRNPDIAPAVEVRTNVSCVHMLHLQYIYSTTVSDTKSHLYRWRGLLKVARTTHSGIPEETFPLVIFNCGL